MPGPRRGALAGRGPAGRGGRGTSRHPGGALTDRAAAADAWAAAALEEAYRAEWGRVLAATARLTGGDLDLAEESTAEAFLAAARTWPGRGIPDRPGGWLTVAARRAALDRLRRESALRARLPMLIGSPLAPDREHGDGEGTQEVDGTFPDDRLRLAFTCCHPALAPEARTALTLRLVCGVPTSDIARVFLVPEATMAARITRAKKKIAAARIPYRVPGAADLPERLDAVLTVVHLLATLGHAAAGDRLVEERVAGQALDLARVLAVLLPAEPEALGLLALLEFTAARRDAREDAEGRLVLLADQDRARWDRAGIARGTALVDRAAGLLSAGQRPGRFLLQAVIAAVHAEAPTWEATDWPAVLACYDRLLEAWPSPVVAVNRGVAVSFVAGPAAGLAALDAIAADPRLADYHYLPAARADLLARLGRAEEARQEYARAAGLTSSAPERAFLRQREADVLAASSPPPEQREQPGLG